jgi:hypothetical protein
MVLFSASPDRCSENIRVIPFILSELELGDIGKIDEMRFVNKPEKHGRNDDAP